MSFLFFIINSLVWVFPEDGADIVKSMKDLDGEMVYHSFLLNAYAVEVPENRVEELKSMEGIREVHPVRTLKSPGYIEMMRTTEREEFDSTEYGSFYQQNAILGVVDAHSMGFSGAGVRIGFLDTGLRKIHGGLKYANIVDEHDFLADDIIKIDEDMEIEADGPLSEIHILDTDSGFYISFVKDTVLSKPMRILKIYGEREGYLNLSKEVSYNVVRTSLLYSNSKVVGASEIYSGSVYNKINVFIHDSMTTVIKQFTGRFSSMNLVDSVVYLAFESQDSKLSLAIFPLSSQDSIFISREPKEKIRDIFITEDGEIYVLDGDVLYQYDQNLNSNGEIEGVSSIYGGGDAVLFVRNDSLYLLNDDKEYFIDTGVWRADCEGRDGNYMIGLEEDTVIRFYSFQDGRLSLHKEVEKEFHYNVGVSMKHYLYVIRGDDNTDYEENEDDFSQPFHGTEMVSLVAAYAPGIGIGVAPSAEILMAKTERVSLQGEGYEYQVEELEWVEGLEWLIRRGCRIISSSLGYRDWYSYKDMDGKTAITSRAAENAKKYGVIIVNAMGNVNETTDRPDTTILAPADAEWVVSAGGIMMDSTLWWNGTGTAQGPTYDGRIKPVLVAPASGVSVLSPETTTGVWLSNGTSNSTALIAGLFALVWEAHPEWTAQEIREAVIKTASNSDSPDNRFGYGIPNAKLAIQFEEYEEPYKNVLLPPYPNPARERLYIPFILRFPTWAEIYLLNSRGELLSSKELNDGENMKAGEYREKEILERIDSFFELKDLKPGLYMVVIKSPFFTERKPVLIVK